MKRIILAALLCLPIMAGAQVKITIDPTPNGVNISPMLYGIFYEDINHAADGGIYAELIRNRSFEDNFRHPADRPDAWYPVGETSLELETEGLLNDAQKYCLHVTSDGEGEAGVCNDGFWGVNAVKGREYRLSLWIKVNVGSGFSASLVGLDGTCYASAELNVNLSEKGWQKVTASFVSNANDNDAFFVLTSKGEADYCLDVVSLFPPTFKNRPNGLRPDLAEMLQELHPRFMRFPGGCFVEGQHTPDNAFRWERTVGPIETRPGHDNSNWGYRTSDGLGFHEYLQLAEDIGAKPLYVCNIGIWHGGVTPLDDVQCWVDECLGALEYANGPVTSKYGAMRAANGHPEPFNLQYIEIGNENNQDDGAQTSDHYYERYRIFHDAILEKWPETHIIGNVAAWGTDEPRWHTDDPVELVDEHYYRSPKWFTEKFEKYDAYSRAQPPVYCGEYAVTNGFGDLGNLNAALGEAVYMMGFENNSDIVRMSSYAPIFVNENDPRWKPDMIRFSADAVMGTPSYYVQKLMSDNLGSKGVTVTEGKQILQPARLQDWKEQVAPGVFVSASLDESENVLIVKIVNTGYETQTADLDLGAFKTSGGELIQLKAVSGMAENTLDNPTNVYPVSRHISLDADAPSFCIPAYSLNILRLQRD
ncbi:MAG: carbohydrate binding domain-containing protein [Bacteroidales bacterium]|nr:carbohydrate binding domain-containing protein [Bacteroidales bacterium]